MTTPDAILRGRIAAHERWAGTGIRERTAATAPARQAADDRFIRLAREKYGNLPEEELAIRATNLRKAHYLRMAYLSAQSRRAKSSRGGAA
jgi:hypothetical protein